MKSGLYTYLKALAVVLMAMLILAPAVSSALHHCKSHSSASSQESNIESHQEDVSSSHHESHDCSCPTHRVDCCHYQARPALPKLNLVSVAFKPVYSLDHFSIPSSPLLDGPFQPPRA